MVALATVVPVATISPEDRPGCTEISVRVNRIATITNRMTLFSFVICELFTSLFRVSYRMLLIEFFTVSCLVFMMFETAV